MKYSDFGELNILPENTWAEIMSSEGNDSFDSRFFNPGDNIPESISNIEKEGKTVTDVDFIFGEERFLQRKGAWLMFCLDNKLEIREHLTTLLSLSMEHSEKEKKDVMKEYIKDVTEIGTELVNLAVETMAKGYPLLARMEESVREVVRNEYIDVKKIDLETLLRAVEREVGAEDLIGIVKSLTN